jgi:hypothetical protein
LKFVHALADGGQILKQMMLGYAREKQLHAYQSQYPLCAMAPLRNIEMENDLTPPKDDEIFFSETLDILKIKKNLRSFVKSSRSSG